MQATVKLLRVLQIAMLVSIGLYIFLGERVTLNPPMPNPSVFYVISLVAITIIGIILVVRRTLVLQSETSLRTQSTDLPTLNRWRAGYLTTYALSESLALFGLVLRILGFTLSQVAPFYVAAFILMVFFTARQPSRELT
ncbi:MAG TPA: hypothetical protein VFA89_17770 [Terriglobales bacterium]|nr:hypothetical protein [Terriglobales bacterium]